LVGIGRRSPKLTAVDAHAVERLGLLAAIRAWRPERGPFPAFADRCVTNQALLALALTALLTSSPRFCELAAISPCALTRRMPRPDVTSPTRESALLISTPSTSIPTARPPSSRMGAYDAMYWSARALSVHTSEPACAFAIASLNAGYAAPMSSANTALMLPAARSLATSER